MTSALILLDKISDFYKEKIEEIRYLRITLFVFSIAIILFGLLILTYAKIYSSNEAQKYDVYASPSKIILRCNSQKDFPLTVTNNKNHSIFDVNLTICANDSNVNIFSIIDIKPVQKDTLHASPYSLYGVILSNGCVSIYFHDLSPHSSKDFYVRANGKKLKDDLEIVFFTHDWALQPSQCSVSTDRTGWPDNFNDFLEYDSTQSEKIAEVYSQSVSFPANPYFPDQTKFKLVEMIILK